jgi:hypothetical protein
MRGRENISLSLSPERVEPLRGSKQRSDHPLPWVSPTVIQIFSLSGDMLTDCNLFKELLLFSHSLLILNLISTLKTLCFSPIYKKRIPVFDYDHGIRYTRITP